MLIADDGLDAVKAVGVDTGSVRHVVLHTMRADTISVCAGQWWTTNSLEGL